MISKQKIVIMTKMAVYDKNEGEADRQANSFFRHDYIYKKNAAARLCVGIGAGILVGLYFLRLFFVEGADFFEMDLNSYIYNSVLFVMAVMAVYSVIGTIQSTRQYYLIQKRLIKYESWLHQLERVKERMRERARRRAEEEGASDLYYGADIDRKGSRR